MTAEQLEEAARLLDVTARLAGPNHLVLLDVSAPAGAEPDLQPALRAACALHHAIEVDDDLVDIEETLEDALKAGDRRAIDDGCELYRALLAHRLKIILDLPEGQKRLEALAISGR